MTKKCYLCLRIDSAEYFRELRDLGFSSDAARFTVGLVEKLYRANPASCSGKKARVIKASLAYIGGIIQNVEIDHVNPDYYGRPLMVRSVVTQLDCAEKFECTEPSIRSTYVPMCRVLGLDIRNLPNVAGRNFRNAGGSFAYHGSGRT